MNPRNNFGKHLAMRAHLLKPKSTWDLLLCNPRDHFGYYVLPHAPLALRDTMSDAEHITIWRWYLPKPIRS